MWDPGGRGRGKVEEKAIVFGNFWHGEQKDCSTKIGLFRNIQEKGLKLSRKGQEWIKSSKELQN
jgi:hypothetical protein